MDEPILNNDTHHPAIYQIKVKGRIEEDWSEWFEGMQIDISKDDSGKSISTLTGIVSDQSALQGILSNIGMLNLNLISVVQKGPDTD